jgi:hypothetical protein
MKKYRYVGLNPALVFGGEYNVEHHNSDDTYSVAVDGRKHEWDAGGFLVEFELIPKGNEEMAATATEFHNVVTEGVKKLKTSVGQAPDYSKHDLLDEAKVATADRGLNYGNPEDNFARIAAHWNAFLANRGIVIAGGGLVSPSDVAVMCALLKIARLENDPSHHDSWVDLAGYAACGAEIELSK